ncbi:PREDICTED: translocation protein SEC63 homolog [Ceratosolen solmsi marchali]|uniref:Translocation protein SEC63 homolog n=1 Tax=Ceratosolen solmsi marchali TaxID=326594 RepID=A0AAJ6YXU8_9HYME|nr:PREDICTED: translocation protein SEC63 homolog [Ceratosolen solmsi marchali]
MSGQKFQYDESGGTFFYFLLSFLALLLVPSTFYLWPRCPKPDPNQIVKECHCDGCKKKKVILQKNDPWKETKALFRKFLIMCGWALLAFLAYKVSQFDYEMTNFDPYEILGVSPSSSAGAIKKAYRQLSLILHPDKETGNEKAFMRLTKAYQALTDKEAMSNWEKYGNPDGPGAMGFGIALPSWIVEKENSMWVLGAYALVFMLALPTVVGMWWYRSIRYTGDQVLLATTKMYYAFFHNTPTMTLKRIIMVLGASFEFEKKYNTDIIERLSDNEEVPALIRQLPNLGEKNKEYPLCLMYSIKARALIHAHLSRMILNPDTLEKDRQYIVKKCPYLIQEMISCVNQLIVLAYARQVQHLPTITTIENCMRLCPMIVQAFWEFKNPLLQLPHITEDHLKYFKAKKVKSLQEYAQLKREDRRSILRGLSDSQFDDVMKVLGNMPFIDFKVRSEVIDDENSTVYTAGAIVTVTVTLTRTDMAHLFGDDTIKEKTLIEESKTEADKEEVADDQNQTVTKRPAWLRQRKVQKKSHSKKGSNKKGAPPKTTTTTIAAGDNGLSSQHTNSSPKSKKDKESNKDNIKEKINGLSNVDSDASESEAHKSDSSDDDNSSHESTKKQQESEVGEDDDTEWNKFQQRLSKRDRLLDGRSNYSHLVHSPYFPDVKQEYWWIYICDRKSLTLLTAPIHVTSLIDTEEFQLRFTAPLWPNIYTFTVCLRSDSYLGFDQLHDIKLDVKEAAAIPTDHPQWEMSDEETEEEVDAADEHSEFTTDEDISDNE